MGTIRHIVEVKAPVDQVFRTWSDPRLFLAYFDFVEKVEFDDESTETKVCYRGAFGIEHHLSFAVTERVENRTLAWKVTESAIPIAGSVSLEESGATTFMTFVFSFDPPLVRLGDAISQIFQYPHKNILQGLVKFATEVES